MNSIREKINIAEITDTVINFDLVPTRMYEITGVDVFHKSAFEGNKYISVLEKFLNGIDERITLQFVHRMSSSDTSLIDAYAETLKSSDAIDQRLIEEISGKYKATPSRSYTCYLAISYDKNKFRKRGVFSRLYREVNSVSDDLESAENALREFEEVDLKKLSSTGITFKALKRDEILSYCYQILNPGSEKKQFLDPHSASHPNSINDAYNGGYTYRDQIAQSAVSNEVNYVQIDGQYVQSIVVDWLPNVSNQSILKTLYTGIQFDHDISLVLRKADKGDAYKELKSKRWMYETLEIFSRDTRNMGSNGFEITSEKKLDEITQSQKILSDKMMELWQFSLVIIVRDSSLSELKRKTQSIRKTLNDIHNMECLIDDYSHLDNMLSLLPGHSDYLHKTHYIFSKPLLYFLPFYARFKGTEKKQLLFHTSLGEQLGLSIRYGENDLSSSHSMVVAKTGAGKSFFANSLILGIRLSSPKDYMTIIDQGNSYKKVCVVMGGDYYDVDFKDEYAISIFPQKSLVIDKKGELKGDQLIYIRDLLTILITDSEIPTLSNSQNDVLEQCITGVYASFEEDGIPILSDLKKYLEEQFEPTDEADGLFLRRLVKNLALYTREDSPYGILLNQRKSLQINNPVVVFEIKNLVKYPKLRNIYFFMIFNAINLRMLDTDFQQDVIYDEAKEILEDPHCAGIISRQYTGARKFGNRIWLITQSLSHLIEQKDIVGNTEIKYVLELDDYTGLDQFNFNESEVEIIRGIQERGRVFVKFGKESFVSVLTPTPLEHEIYATDFQTFQKYKPIYETKMSREEAFALILANLGELHNA